MKNQTIEDYDLRLKIAALNTYMKQAAEAREVPIDFLKFVLRDETGKRIEPASIHKSWHEHIEYCFSKRKYAAIIAPFAHGKTQAVVIGRTLFEIGRNKNIRAKIICADDKSGAAPRVSTIGNIIEHNPDYHAVFPDIVPSKRSSWTDHTFYVERDPGVDVVDPTLEARGITSTGIGSRADLLVFDDIVNLNNAIIEPAMRPKIVELFENVWMTRLEPDGRVIYIATIWHAQDCTAYIKKLASTGDSWCVLIERISSDQKCIEVEVIGNDDDYEDFTGMRSGSRLHLWSRWSTEKLREYAQSRPGAYRRGMRQEAIENDAIMFPSFLKCWKPFDPSSSAGIIKKEFPKVIGVDLSSEKRPGTVLFCAAQDPSTQQRYPVEIRIGKWSAPETARQIADMDRIWQPQKIVVENNAYQQSLIDWIGESPRNHPFHSKLLPFTTGRQKADPDFGLPSLEMEFSKGLWVISNSFIRGHDYYCGCGFCTWKRQMMTYPNSEGNDVVMACWFCREGLKRLSQKSQCGILHFDLLRR